MNARDYNASDKERQAIRAGDFFIRDKMQTFVAGIPGAGGQWLELKLPPEPSIGPWVIAAVYSALGLLLCAFMLVWALPIWRDLEALKTGAQRMGQGDLQARARLSRHSSIGNLGETFNQMSERIGALISNQRELTNAVSHELRTPIARLSFELDMMGRERDEGARAPDRGNEERRGRAGQHGLRVVDVCAAGAQRRPGAAGAGRARLAGLRGPACRFRGRPARRAFEVALCQVAQVHLNQRYMTRALLNLLQNAIRYAGGNIRVSLVSPRREYVLMVDDDGPGIPLADRERIFEPFIRLDESRDRGTGGTGLGLAIVSRGAGTTARPRWWTARWAGPFHHQLEGSLSRCYAARKAALDGHLQ